MRLMKKDLMKKNNKREHTTQLIYPMRLQRYLAKCGLGSRRYCEKLIELGEIKVNGDVVNIQGVSVHDDDSVTYQDTEVIPNKYIYIILHKPVGYLCSNADPYHTQFARDLIDIPEKMSLFHVGRLDMYSSGLIIFTNDGDFAQKISHPSYEIEKEYEVRTALPIDESSLRNIVDHGITIEGISYTIESYEKISSRAARLILKEGKNREIRKIFSYLGYQILSLRRIRIGTIVIDDLPSGSFRSMTQKEISSVTGEDIL